jgi:hypothetical protein
MERMGFEVNKKFAKNYRNRPETMEIGGKTYNFRSQLEIKVAKYLELLKVSGQIKDWAYEQTTFTFDDQIVCKKYIIDFDVIRPDGTFYYIEAKGYVDKHTIDRLTVLFTKRPEVRVWMVFQGKRDRDKFLRRKVSRQCDRVLVLSDMTRGIV